MTDIRPKIYPAEFKESTIIVIESKQTFTQIARELGITKYVINWVNKYSKPKEVMRNDEELYDELKRLKKELDKVTQERDLLKKAAAYFAKESR
ncbi:transposase and inactivated derivative [Trichonephila inaurata madagascariensis]|uniref:Transposase and inactivated derivative n=1 Tax=Trichonephila inaurata madagascariensis TaxID=2747483 RepID=A0A8X6YKQ1_9ARAC|nr:transposase and inactivated derivative [Trichonephila inaurata madagascariensis]